MARACESCGWFWNPTTLVVGDFSAVAGVVVLAEIKEWIYKTGEFGEIFVQDIADEVSPMVTETPPLIPTIPSELVENGQVAELVESPDVPTVEPTAIPTVEPSPMPTAISEPAVTGVVKCRKGCSYPGRCGRYYDDNDNGKCDLGEPIW